MSSFPWDIYAAQLLPAGFGHPLWCPEPVEREIDLGDVGWLSKGRFRPLFNSRRPADDPVNQTKGVPQGFTLLDSANLSILECDTIMQGVVSSGSIRKVTFQGDLEAGA